MTKHINADEINWEKIWKRLGKDILDIVMDFEHGRTSANDTAEIISEFGIICYNQGFNRRVKK